MGFSYFYHFLLVILRVYPFIAVPLIWILVELGLYFRRKKSRWQWGCGGMIGVLLILLLLWLIFRGDKNADIWAKSLGFQ